MLKIRNIFVFSVLCLISLHAQTGKERPPNVILVMTDDQGIGDLACQGNPWLKTPNIDAFYKNAVRLTNFHVSPLCTPTRSAIMTGQYPINSGTWATFKGRATLHHKTPTMAEIFKQNGYATAMFGKWHLGDNYPARPTDCGFETAIHHGSGGIGEITDYWGNDYFDDTYLVNSEPKKFEGYCTDVWFDEAMKYMKTKKDKPFFVYLPTNAPHSPLIVADKYAKPYQALEGKELISANFYGMIANIDENMGKLMQFLDNEQLADNTILIFMSDNGSQYGYSKEKKLGFNKGFSGNKGDKEEGGHRVPFFIRWSKKGIDGGKDIHELCAHIDLIPTLAKLCGISLPKKNDLDGLDFSKLLFNPTLKLKKRTYFTHHRQDWQPPFDVKGTCIAQNNWRLLDGKNLYDVVKDSMETNDVAKQNPKIVAALLKENDKYVAKAKKRYEYQNIPPTSIGNAAQKTAWVTIQHAVGNDAPIYSQSQVAKGVKNANNKHPLSIEKDGKYHIKLQRWSNECLAPIHGLPNAHRIEGFTYKAIHPEKAVIKIQDKNLELNIDDTMTSADFVVTLKKGNTVLEADFLEKGERFGAYYVYIYLDFGQSAPRCRKAFMKANDILAYNYSFF